MAFLASSQGLNQRGTDGVSGTISTEHFKGLMAILGTKPHDDDDTTTNTSPPAT